jgi:phosphatidylglycerophosphatase A
MAEKVERRHRLAEGIWSVGGLGLLPGPTGTYGSVAGVPIYLLLWWAGWEAYLASTAILFLLGWVLSCQAQQAYKAHDDKRVVIDEVVGYLVTMFLAPQFAFLPLAPLWGLAWFRIFDIWKPGPIGKIDKIEGGLFVMLDDVLAGLAATAALWITAAVVSLVKNPYLPELFAR